MKIKNILNLFMVILRILIVIIHILYVYGTFGLQILIKKNTTVYFRKNLLL